MFVVFVIISSLNIPYQLYLYPGDDDEGDDDDSIGDGDNDDDVGNMNNNKKQMKAELTFPMLLV